MSWTYSDEYYRQYTRDTWNESAPYYSPLLRNLDQFTPALLSRARPQAGERVLDVCTGPGEPALTLARVVGPAGRVTGIDLAERMVDAASQRAKTERVENAEFKVMDAEALTLPDSSFDLATCRFGLMIVTNPEKAVAEMRRVLGPRGRVAACVWTDGEHNPAIHSMVGPMLEHAEPDENGYLPTPYELGPVGVLAKLLEDAGFEGVGEERVQKAWTFRNEAELRSAILQGSPLGHSLREEDEAVQEDVLAQFAKNIEPFRRSDGSYSFPGEAVVVWGSKA